MVAPQLSHGGSPPFAGTAHDFSVVCTVVTPTRYGGAQPV
jgi:hypothetical protein